MNRIVIDWLTIVSTIDSPESMIYKLGFELQNWQQLNGMMGYPYRLNNGLINVLYGGKDDMGVCAVLSGQGCRMFEKEGRGDYIELFEEIVNDPDHIWITRLDVAYDDFDGLQISDVARDTMSQMFVSRFQRWCCETSDSGISCTYGSPQSLIKMRIYDKLAEQASKKYITIECPAGIKSWCRVEVQFKKERAMELLKVYSASGYQNIAFVFFGIISNYHRFVEKQDNDDNMRRWPTAGYWQKFFDSANKISLFISNIEQYTIDKAVDYVMHQPIGSLKVMYEVLGEDEFIERIKGSEWPRNPKYKNLVNREKIKEIAK